MTEGADCDLPADPGCRPCIVTDSRERCPLVFHRLRSVVGTLQSADYSMRGAEHVFGVERKSLPDLVASVSAERERFERELGRLRAFRFQRLLVTASEAQVLRGQYRSRMAPRAVLASLRSFEVRYGIAVVFEPDEATAARLIESWASWFCYDVRRSARLLEKGMEAPL